MNEPWVPVGDWLLFMERRALEDRDHKLLDLVLAATQGDLEAIEALFKLRPVR